MLVFDHWPGKMIYYDLDFLLQTVKHYLSNPYFYCRINNNSPQWILESYPIGMQTLCTTMKIKNSDWSLVLSWYSNRINRLDIYEFSRTRWMHSISDRSNIIPCQHWWRRVKRRSVRCQSVADPGSGIMETVLLYTKQEQDLKPKNSPQSSWLLSPIPIATMEGLR